MRIGQWQSKQTRIPNSSGVLCLRRPPALVEQRYLVTVDHCFAHICTHRILLLVHCTTEILSALQSTHMHFALQAHTCRLTFAPPVSSSSCIVHLKACQSSRAPTCILRSRHTERTGGGTRTWPKTSTPCVAMLEASSASVAHALILLARYTQALFLQIDTHGQCVHGLVTFGRAVLKDVKVVCMQRNAVGKALESGPQPCSILQPHLSISANFLQDFI